MKGEIELWRIRPPWRIRRFRTCQIQDERARFDNASHETEREREREREGGERQREERTYIFPVRGKRNGKRETNKWG